MTWRQRIQHPGALVCGLAVTALIASSTVAQARSPSRVTVAPRSGGSIAIRDDEAPDCLDPQKTIFGASFAIFNEIMDSLLTQDDKGNLRPGLATTWTFSHGGKWLTMTLRHGVKFSNGDPFTANAVKYTFARAVNPATKSPASANALTPVKKTVVVNPYKVRLILKAPNRPLLGNLASTYLGILDPKATQQQGSKSCQNPIGTGPYKVQSVAPDFSTVTLVRNPYHTWEPPWYRNHGAPRVQQLVFKPVVSDSTAVSELVTGELDIADVPGPQLNRVQGKSSIKLHRALALASAFLDFNESHPPFNNPAVRRAVEEAIDRKALIKAALSGLAVPAYAPIGVHVPYYPKNAQAFVPPYNPSDARKIIAANHATGPYTLVTFNDPTFVTAAELIQGELAQVGMAIKAEPKPIADYGPLCRQGGCDIDLDEFGWPDADVMYDFLSSTQRGATGTNFANMPAAEQARVDTLLNQGRTAVSPKKATQVYGALIKYLNQQVIVASLWDPVGVTAARSRVKGWHTDFGGIIQYPDLYVTR
jgi:peptide/nickel transport system substrate-binding protein